jgi:hypothetical protein
MRSCAVSSEVDSYGAQDNEDAGRGADRGLRPDIGGGSCHPEENHQASDQALVARVIGCGAHQCDEFIAEAEGVWNLWNLHEGDFDDVEARTEEGTRG